MVPTTVRRILVVFACLAYLCAAEVTNVYSNEKLPVYTSDWAVQLKEGQSIDSITSSGFEIVYQMENIKDWYVVRHRETHARHERERSAAHHPSRDVTSSLLSLDNVKHATQQKLVKRQSRLTANDPLYTSQWHLQNTGQFNGASGNDANLQPAWDSGASGNGILVSVVDDGYQHTHPDLSPRYVAAASYDYRDGDADPSPNLAENFHGTSAAGVAIAAMNSVCGVGAAFQASGAGVRLIGGNSDAATEAAGMTRNRSIVDIFSNSWGPADNGVGVHIQEEVIVASLQEAVTNGRSGKGNIFVWSCGNGALATDNSNYDGFANSRFVIAVGSVGNNGLHSPYSEPGANVVVTAPSNSGTNPQGGIRTTDLLGENGYDEGDCTSSFGGTSSACPLVSGIVALMLEVNPALTWRDVPVILAATARKTAAASYDSDWVNNAAGYHVNHKYGFGVVDAGGAVSLARTHTLLSALQTETASSTVGASIPDNSQTGVSTSLSISSSFFVERVVVTVTASHARAGDLQIVLRSPSGTQSVLADVHAYFPVLTFDGENGYLLGASPAGTEVPTTPIQGALISAAVSTSCTFSSCSSLNGAIAAIPISSIRSLSCYFDGAAAAAAKCGAKAVLYYDTDAPSTELDTPTIPGSGVSVNIPIGYMPGAAYAEARANNRFGQQSAIARYYESDNSYADGWAFQSIRHLGEGSQGTWTVTVRDLRTSVQGSFASASINVYGSTNKASFPPGEVGATPTPAPSSSSSSVLVSFALLALVCFFIFYFYFYFSSPNGSNAIFRVYSI